MERKRCIFCGSSGKLSKEHVFPDWLKPHTFHPEKHSLHSVSMQVHVPGGGVAVFQKGKGKLEGPGAANSKRLKVVCEPCNNRWMSELQTKAKPILLSMMTGGWSALNVDEQKTLAIWATMFTMVVEFAHQRTVAVPAADRLQFMTNQSPPPNWLVWVGQYQGERCKETFHHWGSGITSDPTAKGIMTEMNTQATRFVVGKIVFVTFYSGHPPIFEWVWGSLRAGSKLRCIWPPLHKSLIPPSGSFDDDGVMGIIPSIKSSIHGICESIE